MNVMMWGFIIGILLFALAPVAYHVAKDTIRDRQLRRLHMRWDKFDDAQRRLTWCTGKRHLHGSPQLAQFCDLAKAKSGYTREEKDNARY